MPKRFLFEQMLTQGPRWQIFKSISIWNAEFQFGKKTKQYKPKAYLDFPEQIIACHATTLVTITMETKRNE